METLKHRAVIWHPGEKAFVQINPTRLALAYLAGRRCCAAVIFGCGAPQPCHCKDLIRFGFHSANNSSRDKSRRFNPSARRCKTVPGKAWYPACNPPAASADALTAYWLHGHAPKLPATAPRHPVYAPRHTFSARRLPVNMPSHEVTVRSTDVYTPWNHFNTPKHRLTVPRNDFYTPKLHFTARRNHFNTP